MQRSKWKVSYDNDTVEMAHHFATENPPEKEEMKIYSNIVIYGLYSNLRSSLLRYGTRRPMTLKLTRVGLLVKLANHYTTKGAFIYGLYMFILYYIIPIWFDFV